jgi:hypothetical protein
MFEHGQSGFRIEVLSEPRRRFCKPDIFKYRAGHNSPVTKSLSV